MSKMISKAAAQEWRDHWYLPLVAALGYATASMQVQAMGPFFGPLQQAFGWSRAEISSGLTVCNLTLMLSAVPMGWLIDRWGPRRVGLVGVVLVPCAIALLGTATGSIGNWRLLWFGIAIGMMWCSSSLWSKAVASRFVAGRGLAISVTIGGGPLTALVLPGTATWLIASFGWRHAFALLGIGWMLIVFPLMLLFFRGGDDAGRRGAAPEPLREQTGLTLREALHMPALYVLMFAGACFTFTCVGVALHLVPILTDNGASRMTAAAMVSLSGVFAIIGRLGTGLLLDRFPGNRVGAATYAMPIACCLLLLLDGGNPVSQALAASIFGLTLGAEIDVVTYLATRYFGLRNIGLVLGAIMSPVSIGTALGPLVAGAVSDHFGSYAPFLIGMIGLMGASALALLLLGRPPAIEETAP